MIEYRLPRDEAELLSVMTLARELHGASEWKDATFDDIKTYEEIVRWVRRGYQDPRAFLRVAVDDGAVLGILAGSVEAPFFARNLVAFDHVFYVRSGARHRMIGPRLLRLFMAWAKEAGATSAMLSVTSGANRRMDTFLSRWKFRPVGTYYRRDL